MTEINNSGSFDCKKSVMKAKFVDFLTDLIIEINEVPVSKRYLQEVEWVFSSLMKDYLDCFEQLEI
jgi:hypothetical protein